MSGVRDISRRYLPPLLIGLVVGFLVASVFISAKPKSLWPTGFSSKTHHADLRDLHSSSDLTNAEGPENAHENKTIAQQLYNEVRILCWIMTNPQNHKKKALHVKRTWGGRCNKLIFMSTERDPELETVALPVKEGRDNLWAKTKEAFKYIYKNHIDDADWFLKADDDTYVIVENMRYMLYPYSPTFPIYMGCKFKPYVKQGYMSGGAGYVLSKEAVKRFVEDGIPNKTICRQEPDGSEDVEIGKCLEKVNVLAGDSRDSFGRGRSFPFRPEQHLIPGPVNEDFWYWRYIFYKTDDGLDCCSDNAISFHYVFPKQMYWLHYLIHHRRTYGIVSHSQPLPEKLRFSDITRKVSTSKSNNENRKK